MPLSRVAVLRQVRAPPSHRGPGLPHTRSPVPEECTMTDASRRASNFPSHDPVARLKQLETELRRMTKVFMDGADPIVIMDLDRRLVDMNHEVENVFGWTRDELVGGKTRHLLPPEFQELADSVWERLHAGETVRNYEAAIRSRSGEVVPVLATSFLLTDEGGDPIAAAAILKDITKLKQANDLVARRSDDLKQLTRALAHDLATPLRGISGLSDLLAEDCADQLSDSGREYLGLIRDSAARMQEMIDALLACAKLDHQELQFTAVDCARVFDSAVGNLNAVISESEAVITSDALPVVSGSETLLMQLFQNLIGNAIKFRREESPRVHVTAARTGDSWHFEVRDNGIGIPEKHLDSVFGVFQRLHAEDKFPGTGIGLAACRTIVERHGGTIRVESEVGVGSVFHFTLRPTAE